MARRLVLGSLAFAAAASVVLVVVPSYRQETLTTFADDDPSTATTVATSSRTVVDVHGPRALVVLAVPVLLAALSLAASRASALDDHRRSDPLGGVRLGDGLQRRLGLHPGGGVDVARGSARPGPQSHPTLRFTLGAMAPLHRPRRCAA